MKYIKINILALLLLFLGACESYLDLAPELDLSEDNVYDNYESVQGYLDNCYSALTDHSRYNSQNGSAYCHVAALSDEGGTTHTYAPLYKQLNTGDWLNQGSLVEVGWKADDQLGKFKGKVIANSFYSLRIANKLIDRLPETTTITDEERNLLLGQAYFMRAWHYFEIIRRWGGMPLMDQVFFSDSEQELTRKTYQESSEQIIKDLDQAAEMLPDNWDEANLGRANKVAAKSLKGMVALYAASPLMQNAPGSTTNEKLPYNVEWAASAAKYAAECVNYIDANMPSKQLKDYSGVLSVDQDEAMRTNYRHIFYHAPNYVSDQSLWYINSAGRGRATDLKCHFLNMGLTKGTGNWAWGHSYPTQNLADMYEFRDGTPMDWSNPALTANYLDNRDPRFDNNFWCPGDSLRENLYLASWVDGRDYANDMGWTRTAPSSYILSKFIWPEVTGTTNTQNNKYYYNCIFIRTAQVWLDMAEAMNEAYGPNADPDGLGYTAVAAINKVRDRVNMPHIAAGISKEELRERIRNERAVELCFENHRWFDIRRWMIAEDLFAETNPIKGLRAEKIDPTQGNADLLGSTGFTFSIKDITTERRVFNNKHYWYPLAYDHMNQLSSLKQNPGW